MTTPAAVNQKAQYGTESTPGTPVAAGELFRASTVTLGPTVYVETVRPSGSRFASTTYVKKEYSEGSLEGVPCFNELPGLFNWAFGPCENDGEESPYTHTWTVGAGETRTIEIGDATAAAKIPGCFVKNLTLEWGRNSGDAIVSADIVGGVWTDGVTLTAAPTALAVLPIEAHTVSVYCDSSAAALGTTLLSDALKVTINTGDLREMVWTLDSSKPSFSDRVDLPLGDAQIELMVKATAAGRAFLADLRTGDTKYLRVKAVAGSVNLVLDFAVKAADHTREESDAIWATTTTLQVAEDEDGFSHEFVLTDENATW